MHPLAMRMEGLPQKNARRGMDFMVSTARISSMPSTVRMGTRPDSRGMALSCMGTAARLANSMVTTNSAGSISPICRLPIRRTTRISAVYSSNVRIKEINIDNTPGIFFPIA